VLKPGGQLVFHDVFAGAETPLRVPTPWAEVAGHSYLARPGEVRLLLRELAFDERCWEDRSAAAAAWFAQGLERLRGANPPQAGLHLLMGDTARRKIENMVWNFAHHRTEVCQAVYVRRGLDPGGMRRDD
jgi:hypothetical protein